MPCRDDGWPPTEHEILTAQTPAMLCAVLKALDKVLGPGPSERPNALTVLQAIDWEEAGVTAADFVRWRSLHAARDAARLEHERRRESEEKAKARALEKLTPQEQAALGVAQLRAVKRVKKL